MGRPVITIGLISDTHNLVRPEAKQLLNGVDRILHAGDICAKAVLDELREIAPVTAVRGNNDQGHWAAAIPVTEAIAIGGVTIYMLHDLSELDLDPQAAGFSVVVTGHSHRPAVERKGSVLFVNPGSAGPRRFTLPVSMATLTIKDQHVEARLHLLAR